MLNKALKRNKGITLIALVVTIIVLLILAGISINALTGQNGLLNRAVESKQKTEVAQIEEAIKVAVMDAATQGLGTITDANLKTALNNAGISSDKISGDETKGWKVEVNEKKYQIDKSGNMKEALPMIENSTIPYYPGSTFSYKEGDLDSGLVIKDSSGNEYVWVEVPRTAEVYPNAGVNISSFTDKDYTDIEADLHTYTNDYRNGTSFSDTWYDATNDSNEANKSDWYQNENDYNTAKKKMLKSVYQNGGFWVGRYEAGIEVNRTASGTATEIPLSKENLYPYTYVTRTQAKALAEKVESGSYTSSLMFGVQWDLVLKYIETKNATTQYNLKTDSTTIGNYYKAGRKLVRGQYASITDLLNWKKYTENMDNNVNNKTLVSGDTAIPTLITTGASDETKLQNIYDIAGNVNEWTLEKAPFTHSACVVMGGNFVVSGSDLPASFRTSYGGTSVSDYNIGFRLSLY